MGNSSSSQTPHKTGHKLSKPRTGQFKSSSTASLALKHDRITTNEAARFSNSYLVGASPATYSHANALATVKESEDPVSANPLHSNGNLRVNTAASAGAPRPISNLFRSKSSNEAAESKKQSKLLGSYPGQRKKLVRAGSTINRAEEPLPDSKRLNDPEPRSPIRYNRHSYEATRAGTFGGNTQPNSSQVSLNSNVSNNLGLPQNRLNGAQSPMNTGSDLRRAESEVSLYSPTRRRSSIRLPGVATRPVPDVVLAEPAKPLARRSLPASPDEISGKLNDYMSARRLSMPHNWGGEEVNERTVTPSETPYQQLGGIKFGSLRVVNHDPVQDSPGDALADATSLSQATAATEENYFSPRKGSSIMMHDEPRYPDEHRDDPAKPVNQYSSASVSPVLEESRQPSPLIEPQRLLADGIRSSPRRLHKDQHQLSHLQDSLQTTSKATEHEDELFEDEPRPLDSAPEKEAESVPRIEGKVSPIVFSPLDRGQKNALGVTRTDSGYVSTTSSHSSRLPLSKADSGYSSNTSLDPSVKPKGDVADLDVTSSRRQSYERREAQGFLDSPMASPSPPGKHSDALPSGNTEKEAPNTDGSKETPRSPLASFPIGGLKLPLLRKSKARDTSSSSAKPVPGHARAKSADEASVVPQSQADDNTYTDGKQGKLRRLLSGPRRPRPLTTYIARGVDETIPPLPSHHAQHESQIPGDLGVASQRIALRFEASKETLKTIISVESTEVVRSETPAPEPRPEGEHPRERSHSRSQSRRSFQMVASTVLPARRNSRRHSQYSQGRKTPSWGFDDDAESYDLPDSYVSDHDIRHASTNELQRGFGGSAFDHAMAAMAKAPDYRSSFGVISPPPPPMPSPTGHAGSVPRHPLRSRASAPDFRGTQLSPICPSPEPELLLDLKPKTPPPVSMRTRSFKRSKSSKSSKRSAQSGNPPPPMRRSLSQQSSRENLRRSSDLHNLYSSMEITRSQPPVPRLRSPSPGGYFPEPKWETRGRSQSHVGHRQGGMPMYDNKMPMQRRPSYREPERRPPPPSQAQTQRQGRPSWDGPYPPPQFYPARANFQIRGRSQRPVVRPGHRIEPQPHHPNEAEPHSPPGRILHSYSSPAYRNVPIWG